MLPSCGHDTCLIQWTFFQKKQQLRQSLFTLAFEIAEEIAVTPFSSDTCSSKTNPQLAARTFTMGSEMTNYENLG